MKIIGHRGAAGLALENTIESIKAAIDAGVDAVEIDIRATKDNKLVLCHDKNTSGVSKFSYNVNEHPVSKLQKIKLNNGQYMATLEQAIKAASSTPLVVEGKDNHWARPLAKALKSIKNLPEYRVISFNHQELFTFSQLMPDVPAYALENTNPFDVIRTARVLGFNGIDINFWLLNPLTYILARYHKLDIIVYTVNKTWIIRFIRVLYPDISITTDVPNQFQFLRKKRNRRKNAG